MLHPGPPRIGVWRERWCGTAAHPTNPTPTAVDGAAGDRLHRVDDQKGRPDRIEVREPRAGVVLRGEEEARVQRSDTVGAESYLRRGLFPGDERGAGPRRNLAPDLEQQGGLAHPVRNRSRAGRAGGRLGERTPRAALGAAPHPFRRPPAALGAAQRGPWGAPGRRGSADGKGRHGPHPRDGPRQVRSDTRHPFPPPSLSSARPRCMRGGSDPFNASCPDSGAKHAAGQRSPVPFGTVTCVDHRSTVEPRILERPCSGPTTKR